MHKLTNLFDSRYNKYNDRLEFHKILHFILKSKNIKKLIFKSNPNWISHLGIALSAVTPRQPKNLAPPLSDIPPVIEKRVTRSNSKKATQESEPEPTTTESNNEEDTMGDEDLEDTPEREDVQPLMVGGPFVKYYTFCNMSVNVNKKFASFYVLGKK